MVKSSNIEQKKKEEEEKNCKWQHLPHHNFVIFSVNFCPQKCFKGNFEYIVDSSMVAKRVRV